MTSNTEHLQDQIDQTQQDIHDNLTALQDKLSPTSAVKRSASRVGETLESARDTVMGRAQDSAAQAGTAVSEVPERINARTNGNPLAMGLLAFSAGWLVGSLIPATDMERRQAQAIRSRASDAVEPVVDTARDLAESVMQQAGEAAQSVAEQTKDSVAAVKDVATGDNGSGDSQP